MSNENSTLRRPGPFQYRSAAARNEPPSASANRRRPLPMTRSNLATVVGVDEDDERESGPPMAEPPLRRYECQNYDGCLDLAAALNWTSFTCTGCDGSIDQHLAHRAQLKAAQATAALPADSQVEPLPEEENDDLEELEDADDDEET